MKQITKLYRHGDLLLKKIDTLPVGLNKLNTKILAEGEITGHKHTFSNGMAQILQEPVSLQKYVQVEQEAELTHQEHNAIKIKEGLYVLIQEREYNPFEAEIRQVMD